MYQTSFIGRTGELARLDELFAGGARVVTILGPPGIGKTRLAQRFADERTGSRFVDLTEARDEDDLVRLAAVDASSDALIVLDNFEQLVDSAPLIARWLDDAPLLRVLVTSREQLRTHGEAVLNLEPLASGDAVQLFVERAPNFELSADDTPFVDRIVRRLEGIPLAIELAASRTRVLSPAQLADRLDKQFDVLTSGVRGASARHATLRNAINWSWSLLSAEEQSALAQCSVFRGGFPLAAAEAVIDLSDRPDAAPLLDVLQGLTEKSLLRTFRFQDQARFALYESIREFAGERLGESNLRGPTIFRHSAHYARMSREIGVRVVAPSGLSFVGQLQVELDNLVYALESMLDQDDTLRRAAYMGWKNTLSLQDIVSGRGKLGAFDVLRDAALDLKQAADDEDYVRLRAETLRIIGTYYGAFGRPDDARVYFERALEASRACGDHVRARVLYGLGTLNLAVGELDEGRRALDDARAICERERDKALLGHVLAQFGNLQLRQGRPDAAATSFEQSLSLARERGDERDEALLLGNLGIARQEQGKLEDARACFERSLALHRANDDALHAGGALGYLGTVAHERGDYDQALEHYEEALAEARSAGARRSEALFLCWMGSVFASCGRPDAARATFEIADSKARDVGDGGLFTTLELHRAGVAIAEGDRSSARKTIDRVKQWLSSTDDAHSYSAADQSDDLRFGVRILDRELGANAFAVARDGTWFEQPGGERVSLAQRHRLRRLFAALVAHYLTAPGEPMSLDELIEHGWPGEKMDAESAINRVHVSLTTLRKLGLRELLNRDEQGYYLDSKAAIVVRS